MIQNVRTVAVGNLTQLNEILQAMQDEHYARCSDLLLGASIGQHVRHILEFYLCFKEGHNKGVVNYDLRKRDYAIEQNRSVAIETITEISQWILTATTATLLLEGAYGENETQAFSIPTNFERELVYNIEHAIHHMAIIKIAGTSLYHYDFPVNFGIADSTLNYQAQHVHR